VSRFRPCIDLHQGRVKQIVGGTLRDGGEGPRENFVSERGAAWYAAKFRDDGLEGGHVIQLGPGNEEAAREALAAWPGGLQLGGGVNADNAAAWLERGAAQVIVTSWLFTEGGTRFEEGRARELAERLGAGRVVIDLSCRRRDDAWIVCTNRWQTHTDLALEPALLERLAPYCAEFLVHAADVEGLSRGIDEELVAMLGGWRGRPTTYAGGAASMAELRRIEELSDGFLDVTVGSALDLFGGRGVSYDELLAWSRA